MKEKMLLCVVIFITLMSCQMDNDGITGSIEKSAVVQESLTIRNNNRGSIQFDLMEDGTLAFLCLEDRETFDIKNSAGKLLRKYFQDKQYGLGNLYREFTGEKSVPACICDFETQIEKQRTGTVTEESTFVDTGDVRIETTDTMPADTDRGIYDPGGYYTKDEWIDLFDDYKYCAPNRTDTYYVKAWTDFIDAVAQPYRGEVRFRILYKKSLSWHTSYDYDVPQRFIAFGGLSSSINRWMKAEVIEADGDGYHVAIDVD